MNRSKQTEIGVLKGNRFLGILSGLLLIYFCVPRVFGLDYQLRITTPNVEPGRRILVECRSPAQHDKNAWIGFYRKEANDKSYLAYTFLLNLNARQYDAVVPEEPGFYNFRVFADKDYTPAAVSDTIQVKENGMATVIAGTGTPDPATLAQRNPVVPVTPLPAPPVNLPPVVATPLPVAAASQASTLQISKVSSTPLFLTSASNAVTICFTVDQPCEATVAVHELDCVPQFMGGTAVSLSSNIVKRIKQACQPGANTVVWDGGYESGVVSSNQYFTYQIEAVAGSVRAAWKTPAYLSGPVAHTNFRIDSNFCFQANRPLKISYDLQAPAFVMLAVPQEPYPVVWGEPRDKGTNVEYFKGRSSINGAFRYGPMNFSMLTQVLPENIVILKKQPKEILKSLAAESYLIIPTYAQVSEIQYTLEQPAAVEVQIKDPNGNLITLLPGQSEAAGLHRLEWAGLNNSNRLVHLPGDYEVIVKADLGSKGLADTKTANVSVRR